MGDVWGSAEIVISKVPFWRKFKATEILEIFDFLGYEENFLTPTFKNKNLGKIFQFFQVKMQKKVMVKMTPAIIKFKI